MVQTATDSSTVLHGFSVDVEDWFHIIDCDGAPDTAQWDLQQDRVELGTLRFLDLLDRHGHKATFFVLGWVARRHPELVAEIARRGHELCSHSDQHRMVHAMSRDEFARDLDASLEALTAAAGKDVVTYRAPGFSIGNAQNWAFDVLVSRGIQLDSSLFLSPRAHGGYTVQRRRPFRIIAPSGGQLTEVPVVPWSPAVPGPRDVRLAYSGGGYLRLLPAPMLRRLYAAREAAGEPVVTYLHPRELDPEQPRMKLPPWRAFKYYVGLDTVADKVDDLFSRFRFGALGEVAAAGPLGPPLCLAPIA